MRNNKWFARADWLLWTVLSLLPLIAYLFSLWGGLESTFVSFVNVFVIRADNPVYNALEGMFGANGIFPVLNSTMIAFFTYFIMVHIVHVFVDTLLVIPRFAHELMDGFPSNIE